MICQNDVATVMNEELYKFFKIRGIETFSPFVEVCDQNYCLMAEPHNFNFKDYDNSKYVLESFCAYFNDFDLEDSWPDPHSYYFIIRDEVDQKTVKNIVKEMTKNYIKWQQKVKNIKACKEPIKKFDL